MKAVRFVGAGRPPEIVDVPRPTPGPGQVVIKIAGAGVCHSDLHLFDEDFGLRTPFTLGHENAGWIDAVGAGVEGWKPGDAVAVCGPWGCGRCHACQSSAENYCEQHAFLDTMGGGLGADGGMAEYMLVPSARLLVPLGTLDPRLAAPLSDAGLTPYHAIKAALPLLHPGTTAVVVGIGGLGHLGVQILRALSAVRIIACDVDEQKLAHARALGVEHAINTSDTDAAAKAIRRLCGPRGAVLALDFVGAQATINLCTRVVGRNSRLTIVGLGGGTLHYSANQPPYGCAVSIPYWGSRIELMEVIALAADGRIRPEVEQFPLERAVEVYQKLRDGQITGRAVLVP